MVSFRVGMGPNWREASTLILTALKRSKIKSNQDFTVLSAKRSSGSSFMSDGIVFPGGKTHFVDSSEKWLNYFPDSILEHYSSVTLKETPPIIQSNKFEPISKLLSLKITAIRETFEEVGILLCSKKDDFKKENCWASHKNFPGLNEWRTLVQNDPIEFINLCQYYNCYPDVENLHLWSNWLTPTSMGSKRFDTVFFIGFLKDIPMTVADNKEIENLNWRQPHQLVSSYKNRELWLPPPQFYELSRLLQFDNIEDMNRFAYERSREGCQRWMPQQVLTLDGSVSLLPGDDAYNVTDYCSPTEPDKVYSTAQHFRVFSNVLHRMEFLRASSGTIIVDNYHPTNGHLLPAFNAET